MPDSARPETRAPKTHYLWCDIRSLEGWTARGLNRVNNFMNPQYDCGFFKEFRILHFITTKYTKHTNRSCTINTLWLSVSDEFFLLKCSFCPKISELLKITGQVSKSLRPTLTASLGVNYPQIHHVFSAVPRSTLLGWRKPISHQEIINQQYFWAASTSDTAFFHQLLLVYLCIQYKKLIQCVSVCWYAFTRGCVCLF